MIAITVVIVVSFNERPGDWSRAIEQMHQSVFIGIGDKREILSLLYVNEFSMAYSLSS